MKFFAIVILVLLSSFREGKAQILNNWFRQKKAQKEYLMQQIAALKVYTGYLEKGYSIAKDGLEMIGTLKDGEVNLHSNYFSGLKKVNPEVGRLARVAEIATLQVSILMLGQSTYKQLKKEAMLGLSEYNYIKEVFNKVLKASEQCIEQLIAVTTDGRIEMSDDERLKRIDQIHAEMEDNYTFCKAFCLEVVAISKNKLHEQEEIQTSRLMRGIKK